ncbi:hypothetical protein FPHYL_2157 [Fusarium phyllophilum]|uniref:Fungal N-terminal domain-containing protein n=1 Tax=Fusarium phyllophilum TaxID=47803 RepID=A0A8H5KA31_9HYPO|nr:hypothetical protein FPHYL_2157 [Fusarium phyllophilum]
MDPMSFIASIAGIASAGTQLSNTLFKLDKAVKNAHKETQSVAIEISGPRSPLEHLRNIIKSGQSYAKSQFCDAVRHVVKNIQITRQGINKMMADGSMLRRVKWFKAARLLSDIEKHKVTLTLQIAILSAAVLVKSTNGPRPRALSWLVRLHFSMMNRSQFQTFLKREHQVHKSALAKDNPVPYRSLRSLITYGPRSSTVKTRMGQLEALQQLGLVVTRLEEGRVLLDPSTTWKHTLEASSPAGTTDPDAGTSPVPDRRARFEDESEVDIIDLLINKEPKKVPESTTEAQIETVPVALQPQISVTHHQYHSRPRLRIWTQTRWHRMFHQGRDCRGL